MKYLLALFLFSSIVNADVVVRNSEGYQPGNLQKGDSLINPRGFFSLVCLDGELVSVIHLLRTIDPTKSINIAYDSVDSGDCAFVETITFIEYVGIPALPDDMKSYALPELWLFKGMSEGKEIYAVEMNANNG